MSARAPLLEAGTVVAERFRVVRTLGMGGMGAVYEIEHEHTKHRRALKLLHPQWAHNEKVVTRFLREASAAGRIGNPHIIETFDAGRLDTGEPYLVMELLEGRTLAELIRRHPEGLPFDEAASLLAQACRGVQAAHDANIVHRDLKPENLFVAEVEGRPFVKVLDFGVSKFEPGQSAMRATEEGSIVGTPLYMSPEQLADDVELDGRSDVYALGVIAFEALTGSHPYACDSLPKLALRILEAVPPRVDAVRAELPRAAADLVAKALAKDRDQRVPTPAALGEGLARVAATPELDVLGATLEAPSSRSPDTEVSEVDATVEAPGAKVPRRPVRVSVRPASARSAAAEVSRDGSLAHDSSRSTAPPPPSTRAWWPWLAGAGVVLGVALLAQSGETDSSTSAHPDPTRTPEATAAPEPNAPTVAFDPSSTPTDHASRTSAAPLAASAAEPPFAPSSGPAPSSAPPSSMPAPPSLPAPPTAATTPPASGTAPGIADPSEFPTP